VFTYYIPVLIPILGVETGVIYVSARAGIALAITVTGVLAGGVLLSERNVDRSALAEVDATGPDADERTSRGARSGGRDEVVVDAPPDRPAARGRLHPRDRVRHPLRRRGPDERRGADHRTLRTPGRRGPRDRRLHPRYDRRCRDAGRHRRGIFTLRTAVASLLIGGILSFAVSTFRRSIPFQYGIWGAEFGTKVIAVNTALKLLFISITVALLLAPVW